MRVVRLAGGEADRFRTIRLRALAADPPAFARTLAEEEVLPLSSFSDWMSGATVLVAVDDDGRDRGLTVVMPDDIDDRAVKIVSMWVDPLARKQGAGQALIEAAIASALERHADLAYLWVVDTNVPAVSLYERMGFQRTGEREQQPGRDEVWQHKRVKSL